jgi:peroxiredoxin Q/BCP
MAEALKAGDPAPAFEMASTEGSVVLRDVLARGRLVLAFYFQDATPACETEIGMLRDSHDMLREFGAGVLAVSADALESHRAFAERLGGLPFPLASDETLTAARAYGVVDEGDSRRSRRAVFVIERDGTLLLALPHFQPTNLAQVGAIFTALGAE